MSGIVDRLRAQHARALARPKQLDKEIPGYDGLLVVRYKPLPWEQLRELLDRSLDPEQELEANVDGIVRACDRIMVRQDDGELVSLADELRAQGETVDTESGEVRFDHKLVEVLGLEVAEPSARATALAAFSGTVSAEVAIWHHATALAGWMRGASQEVDVALGEDFAAAEPSSSPQEPTPSE